MPTTTPSPARKPHHIPTNRSGKAPIRPLPPALLGTETQPRQKKGESLIHDSFLQAKLISESLQQLLLRPGKKDWNTIKSQVWCFGVLTDKVLGGLEHAEELRIKLPDQLQDGVKLMVQVQLERSAGRPTPITLSPSAAPVGSPDSLSVTT